jgi:hypothetical protein
MEQAAMQFALSLQIRELLKVSHSTEEYKIPDGLKVRSQLFFFIRDADMYKSSIFVVEKPQTICACICIVALNNILPRRWSSCDFGMLKCCSFHTIHSEYIYNTGCDAGTWNKDPPTHLRDRSSATLCNTPPNSFDYISQPGQRRSTCAV